MVLQSAWLRLAPCSGGCAAPQLSAIKPQRVRRAGNRTALTRGLVTRGSDWVLQALALCPSSAPGGQPLSPFPEGTLTSAGGGSRLELLVGPRLVRRLASWGTWSDVDRNVAGAGSTSATAAARPSRVPTRSAFPVLAPPGSVRVLPPPAAAVHLHAVRGSGVCGPAAAFCPIFSP